MGVVSKLVRYAVGIYECILNFPCVVFAIVWNLRCPDRFSTVIAAIAERFAFFTWSQFVAQGPTKSPPIPGANSGLNHSCILHE